MTKVPSDNTETNKASILVVDDEQPILDYIRASLEKESHIVVVYSPGISDESILQGNYDVVLLDIFMPGIDGFAIHREVIKNSPCAQFIVITGRPDQELVEKITELGFYGLLTKPFTAEQIRYSVMGALRVRKLLRVKVREDAEATRRIDLVGTLRRIDAIVNSIGEGLLAVDDNNAVVLMNKAAEKITGISFGESAGVPLQRCGLRKEVKEYLKALLNSKIDGKNNKILKVGLDGVDTRYYSANVQEVTDGNGNRTGSVVTLMDRTEACNMERLRESFLSVAAHELRTPITILMNYLCLLQKTAGNSLTPADALNDMFSTLRRMRDIVNSIINFVTLSASQYPSCNDQVDIGVIIRGEIDRLKKEADEKKVSFEMTISLATLRFFSDPGLVKIAVYNVLNNAVKFNRENGKVFVNVRKNRINGRDAIAIDVSDEGEGLNESIVQSLFESFSQGEEHMTRIHPGLGCGLFLAQRAARLLGGIIRAESLPQRGSRFTLELPCSRTPAPLNENKY